MNHQRKLRQLVYSNNIIGTLVSCRGLWAYAQTEGRFPFVLPMSRQNGGDTGMKLLSMFHQHIPDGSCFSSAIFFALSDHVGMNSTESECAGGSFSPCCGDVMSSCHVFHMYMKPTRIDALERREGATQVEEGKQTNRVHYIYSYINEKE